MLTLRSMKFPRKFGQAEHRILAEPLLLGCWVVPAGTRVTLKETRNFGWCTLPPGTRDAGTGLVIPRRIFRE